jgi:hypothetical protein
MLQTAFQVAQGLDFASSDLASLDFPVLQRLCSGLSKYDVQNPGFSQLLLEEIENRTVYPNIPFVILKW